MLPQPALRCTSILILPEGVFVDNAAVERVEDGGGDERFYKEIEDCRKGYILVSSSLKKEQEQDLRSSPSNNHPPKLTPLTFSLPYGNPVFTPCLASRVWFHVEAGAAVTWCD
jgi:hypothetical protein